VKKLILTSLAIFQHNHHLCQDICLAWLQGFVFQCHSTPPFAHATM